MGWFSSIGKAFSSAGNFIAKTATNVANTTLDTIVKVEKVAENVGTVALHQVENVGKAVVQDVQTVFTKPQNLFSNIQRQLNSQVKLITNDFNKIVLPKIVMPVIHQAEKIGDTALKVVEPIIEPVIKPIEKLIEPVIKPIEKEIEKIINPEPVKINTNKLIVDNLITPEHLKPVNIYPDDTHSLVSYKPVEKQDNTLYYMLGGLGALFLLTKK